ncbi:uncharacterized protein PFL1_06809 [Pseudozyma flocculosa PF-1]|uniref:Related to allantoate permease n=2 Tax=Pseudozyma flocculosa TaxID=84751 RepID=A0A5C3F369_9BASI|nr:uncharacterized protein PFL1_06809 [Pseudozyma flocculosa PF-1]EPQ25629.1 hypothetical protein PFL1_06809 [Pseudozyma flocculosa PF-1]SPO38550.1 related to allantoate permease [Pseudozyma flocculosa]
MSAPDTPSQENEKKLHPVESTTTDASFLEKGIKPSTVPVLPSTIVEEADQEVLAFTDQSVIITPEENKRLLRKIDKRVLVIMLGTYFAQSLDKGTLAFAAIMGIRKDLHLVGQQYSWLTTCLYLAILVCEFPQNRLVQILPINRWLGFCIISWGVVVTCTAAVENWAGAMVVRTLLGAFECVCQPAFILLSAVWYRKEEQARTVTLWYCMNGVQAAVGGLLAYGFYHIKGAAISSWQILYVTLGSATILWGAFCWYWLPSSPMRARGFTEEERTKCLERVRENQTGVQNKKFKKDQLIEALLDPQTWALFLIQVLNTIPTGGLGVFMNIVISTNLGFTVLQTNLLSIAQGAFQVVGLLSAAWISTKWNQTIYVAILWTIPAVVASVCFLTVPNTPEHAAGLLIAFYFTLWLQAQATLSFSLLTRNVAGQTKRSIITAITFIGWSGGNSIGPQLFQAKDGPLYRGAFAGQLGCYAASITVLMLLRLYYVDQNRRKRKASNLMHGRDENAADEVDLSNAFADLTDKQNIHFRYSY